MVKLSIIGGIIGLIGGVLMFVEIFLRLAPQKYGWIVNLILASLVIVASLIGMKGKRFGGELLLVLAFILIIIGIVTVATPNVDILPYSVFGRFGIGHPSSNLVEGIPLEVFIIILGGILVIASTKNKEE
ncbi:MAG TPA: hypothetical protein VKK79_01250 [Candidatus Lokiarchaeia archaeon]|nr:hypothetical protein [Candidatus Lokiarchaeia archaeon]